MKITRWLALGLYAVLGTAAIGQEVDPNAKTLFQGALEYYRAGEMDRAIDSFLKAYAADGAILAENDEGLIDGVINYLEGTLKKSPDNADAHYKLGDILNLSGRLPEAVGHFERVVQLTPQSPLGQNADAEAKKLKAIIASQKAAAPAADEEGDGEEKDPDEEKPGDEEDEDEEEEAEPEVDPLELEKSQTEAKTLKAKMVELQLENKKVAQELDALRKEHDALKKQADEWKKYYNLFFSNPANVKALQNGEYR